MKRPGDDSLPEHRGGRSASDEFAPAERTPAAYPQTSADHQPPESGLPTSFDSEDFLFHIYRGSELLADNCVSEAKEELEQALRVQPQDAESQGLLGIVYFRLGMYPRAIRIYQELIRAYPQEITPRINAALCYLKTNQLVHAREVLQEVIDRVPDHTRAWGYLGLVSERLGDYDSARTAFERAGQPQMVQRMEQRLRQSQPAPDQSAPPEHEELRQVAADAVRQFDSDPVPFVPGDARRDSSPPQPGRSHSLELGRAAVPPAPRPPAPQWPSGSPVPPPPAPAFPRPAQPPPATPAAGPVATEALPASEFAQEALLVLPDSGFSVERDGVVVLHVPQSVVVCVSAVRALLAKGDPFRSLPVYRRLRGRTLDEPLGGVTASHSLLQGSGHVALAPAEGRRLVVLDLAGELLYVRESRLIAFDAAIRYENGRLARAGGEPIPMVQLSGRGSVIVETAPLVRSLRVELEHTATVEVERVVGWTGRLLPRPAPPEQAPGAALSYVTFTGEGMLLVDFDG